MKSETAIDDSEVVQPEPRWHALLAVVAVGSLYFALQDDVINFKGKWMFPAIVMALIVPILISHAAKFHKTDILLGYILNVVLTIEMIISVYKLVETLITVKDIKAITLLSSAGLLWFTNIVVFALWYWRLDAGGPHKREKTCGHPRGSFLFPQMTLNDEEAQNWSPNFVDYLFISFNNSTAFSPTDVPVLSRWAKFLTMLQSVISLTVVALLLARAVNILGA